MKIHELKIWPEHFAGIEAHTKRAEIRLNDRDFKVGDILKLNEYDPDRQKMTGIYRERVILHIIDGADGLAEGFVVLSLGVPDGHDPTDERSPLWVA